MVGPKKFTQKYEDLNNGLFKKIYHVCCDPPGFLKFKLQKYLATGWFGA